MKRPRSVAIYARVSTLDQNPEAQLAELRDYATRREFQVFKEYVDHVTGDVARRRRVVRIKDIQFQAMMGDAGARRFNTVLVWKYDRFARSLIALIEALETFNALGVEFISITEQVDTTTPQGRLLFQLVAGFAEYERAMIAERVRSGLANARKNGIVLGRPRDAQIEARVMELRQQGLDISAISRKVKRSRAGVRKILARQLG